MSSKVAILIAALSMSQLAACSSSANSDERATDGGVVTGIGGVFFKVDDPEETRAWYRQHLGISGDRPGVNFLWREHDHPETVGLTVWSTFPRETEYFGSRSQKFMINYRVRGLDSLLAKLRQAGVQQVGEVLEDPNGRFAWIVDGDGRRVELWEPPPASVQP